MAFEALAFLGGEELHKILFTITGADYETLASVNANPAKEIGSESLRSDRTAPLSTESGTTPPPGKVDGVDGGFVNDDGKRYWVSGPGHYQYTYDANGNVTDRRWIPDTQALKAFRIA